MALAGHRRDLADGLVLFIATLLPGPPLPRRISKRASTGTLRPEAEKKPNLPSSTTSTSVGRHFGNY